MKTFRNVVVVKHPLERVFATVRDRLPEIASLLDEIDCIVVLEREQLQTDRLRLVNEWRSRHRIPAMVRGALGGADAVSWIDRNEWDERERRCAWAIEPSVLREHIRCAGTTAFEPAMGGRATRVTFAGEFELAPGVLRGLAGALEQPATAFVESIVTLLIPKNLHKVMDAAGRLIAGAS